MRNPFKRAPKRLGYTFRYEHPESGEAREISFFHTDPVAARALADLRLGEQFPENQSEYVHCEDSPRVI